VATAGHWHGSRGTRESAGTKCSSPLIGTTGDGPVVESSQPVATRAQAAIQISRFMTCSIRALECGDHRLPLRRSSIW